jgi:hypothetical protein
MKLLELWQVSILLSFLNLVYLTGWSFFEGQILVGMLWQVEIYLGEVHV